MKTLILTLVLLFTFGACEFPNTPAMSAEHTYAPQQAHKSSVTYDSTQAHLIRFLTFTVPAIGNEPAHEGMQFGFHTMSGLGGQMQVGFTLIYFNTSTTQAFSVPFTDPNIVHGDVEGIFLAELLDNNGTLVQTASHTALTVSQAYPVNAGYPQAEQPKTIAPRWADQYEYNTPGQQFDFTSLHRGQYKVRFTFDPSNRYGEFQVLTLTVQWDGNTLSLK